MNPLITNLLDSIKARLVAASAGQNVTIDYTLDKDIASFNGFFVNLYLLGAAKFESATRGEDYFDVKVGVVVGNRSTDRGNPTRQWIEQQIDKMIVEVYNVLTSARAAYFVGGFWPQSDEMPTVISHEFIREKKVSYSEFAVVFRSLIVDTLAINAIS